MHSFLLLYFSYILLRARCIIRRYRTKAICGRDCQLCGRGGGAYYIQSRLTHSFIHYYEAAQETRLILVNTRHPK